MHKGINRAWESIPHEAADKTGLPKNLFSPKVHFFRIASAALSTGPQKSGFTLSTRITAIVCWRLILSPTSLLQPGHPAWMCLRHVIPLCGLQQWGSREAQQRCQTWERCFKIWQCHRRAARGAIKADGNGGELRKEPVWRWTQRTQQRRPSWSCVRCNRAARKSSICLCLFIFCFK